MNEEQGPPYDFSTWELGEDALTEVESAVLELLEQARDKTLRLNWPDLQKLHEALIRLVQDQLAFAFTQHRSGYWSIATAESGAVRWFSEVEREGEGPPSVILRPRQLISLLIAPLSARLSELPASEFVEPHPDFRYGDDFDWDENWELALKAAKEWHRAILATLTGLKALRRERTERVAEATRQALASNGDNA